MTGPSGAGKGTLIHALVDRVPELEVAVSATTRLRRRGEEDGHEYWFLSDAEFVRRVHEGEFLEHVTYVSGKRYGTLRSEVDRIAGDAEENTAGMRERRISYVFATGAGSLGPVKDFRLVVDKGRPDRLVSFCFDNVKKITPTAFEVRMRDFTPLRDLKILLIGKAD